VGLVTRLTVAPDPTHPPVELSKAAWSPVSRLAVVLDVTVAVEAAVRWRGAAEAAGAVATAVTTDRVLTAHTIGHRHLRTLAIRDRPASLESNGAAAPLDPPL
jgi:hypothetical protein